MKAISAKASGAASIVRISRAFGAAVATIALPVAVISAAMALLGCAVDSQSLIFKSAIVGLFALRIARKGGEK